MDIKYGKPLFLVNFPLNKQGTESVYLNLLFCYDYRITEIINMSTVYCVIFKLMTFRNNSQS